jgi:hypothetical protein
MLVSLFIDLHYHSYNPYLSVLFCSLLISDYGVGFIWICKTGSCSNNTLSSKTNIRLKTVSLLDKIVIILSGRIRLFCPIK